MLSQHLGHSPQNTVHFLPGFFTGGGQSTARMASSNTVFKPRCVRAEHSRYFTDPRGKTAPAQPLQSRQDMLSRTHSTIKSSVPWRSASI